MAQRLISFMLGVQVYAAGEDHAIFVAKSGCQVLVSQWNVG